MGKGSLWMGSWWWKSKFGKNKTELSPGNPVLVTQIFYIILYKDYAIWQS